MVDLKNYLKRVKGFLDTQLLYVDRTEGDVIQELQSLTTDVEPETVRLRALRVYLQAVRCIKDGGTIHFHMADGTKKILKIRLR